MLNSMIEKTYFFDEMAKGTALEMRELRDLIERRFGELNDKFDQSILELKEFIASSRIPEKGKALKQSANVNASSAGYGNSSTLQAEKKGDLPTEDEKIDHVTTEEEETDMIISMDAVVEYSEPYKGVYCVTGYHGKRPLTVLMGIGGTSHNFIDESLADKLGCNTFQIKPRTVSSAFGKMVTSRACNNFQLSLQGILFCLNLYLLPLSSNCDMVLGGEWLGTLEKLTIGSGGVEFYFQGKKQFVRLNESVDEGSER